MDNGGNSVNLADILSEIEVPDIAVAPEVLSNSRAAVQKDLFAEQKHKKWKDNQVGEARCDFTRKVRLTRRGVLHHYMGKVALRAHAHRHQGR